MQTKKPFKEIQIFLTKDSSLGDFIHVAFLKETVNNWTIKQQQKSVSRISVQMLSSGEGAPAESLCVCVCVFVWVYYQ